MSTDPCSLVCSSCHHDLSWITGIGWVCLSVGCPRFARLPYRH